MRLSSKWKFSVFFDFIADTAHTRSLLQMYSLALNILQICTVNVKTELEDDEHVIMQSSFIPSFQIFISSYTIDDGLRHGYWFECVWNIKLPQESLRIIIFCLKRRLKDIKNAQTFLVKYSLAITVSTCDIFYIL